MPASSEILTDVVTHGPSTLSASVHGEFDLHNFAELRGRLFALIHDHKPTSLILNLRDVPYMDSAGIAVLVETMREIKTRHSGRLYLTHLQKRVDDLLRIARLEKVFVICPTTEDALAKIGT